MEQPNGDPLPGQNLVVLTTLPILEHHQYLNTKVLAPTYLPTTADPRPSAPIEIKPDRPILHLVLDAHGSRLHLLVAHLKSRIPVSIPGQRVTVGGVEVWRTASGWAEGSLLSSMRRVTQALELRCVIDDIFEQEPQALIVSAGDFNADVDDVPLDAIRGAVEDNENPALSPQVMAPCELPASDPSRFSLYHHGRGLMFDHVLVSRGLLALYRGTEIHNELVHDESVAFATDVKYPESDHAPIIATFAFDLRAEPLVGVGTGAQRSDGHA
jgi:hypothetical protein